MRSCGVAELEQFYRRRRHRATLMTVLEVNGQLWLIKVGQAPPWESTAFCILNILKRTAENVQSVLVSVVSAFEKVIGFAFDGNTQDK